MSRALLLISLCSCLFFGYDANQVDFNYSERIKPRIQCIDHRCESITVRFNAFNRSFSLNVKRNEHLLKNESTDLNSQCHYVGYSNESLEKWIALSNCRGELNGAFVDDDFYHLHFDREKRENFIFRNSDLRVKELRCDSSEEMSRPKRSILKGFTLSDSKTRFVELILVNDNRVFTLNERNQRRLVEENQKIANIINAFYRQLNVQIVLVDVVIWAKYDEIAITANTNKTLREFLNYRGDVLLQKTKHDNAQLITGVKFEGDIVGKAIKGSICDRKNSGGINYYHSKVMSLVATTIAHEMGHNFGMEHDHSECVCPSRGACIMAESVGHVSPEHWSSCSRNLMKTVLAQPYLDCLLDEPTSSVGPYCGNGVLEEGEECDCDQTACERCCDRKTCKLKPKAECGTGICCDMDVCKVIRERDVCRRARTECDINEYCDGKSEFCPRDTILHDGVECSGGYCYSGQCNTREKQCKLLWGPESRVADNACSIGNTEGKTDGNCGYDYENERFIGCRKKDVMCGLLFCETNSQSLKYEGDYVTATLSRKRVVVTDDSGILRKWKDCHSTVIKNGPNHINPGLVPNGNKCGDNMMCVNQRCVNVSFVINANRCPNNCNNNGICGNDGVCHCNDGSQTPDCGTGSSSSVLVSLLIVFLIICALSALVFLVYKYKHKSPRIPKLAPKKRKFANVNNARTLPISPPITNIVSNPISQVNSISANVPQPQMQTRPARSDVKVPVRRAPPPPEASTTSITAISAVKPMNGVSFSNASTKSNKSSNVSQMAKMFEQRNS